VEFVECSEVFEFLGFSATIYLFTCLWGLFLKDSRVERLISKNYVDP
jgi:hypothetical protein